MAAASLSVEAHMTPYYHGDTSKKACEALLLTNGGKNVTGKYLFRKSKISEYVLSVIYKGKVTHHMITKQKGSGAELPSSDSWLINGSDTGTHSLAELAAYLSKTRGKKWPLALTEGVPGLPVAPSATVATPAKKEPDVTAAAAAAESARLAQQQRELDEDAAAAAATSIATNDAAVTVGHTSQPATGATGESRAFLSGERVMEEMTPYYHGDIGDEEVNELLSVMRHGGAATGNFLLGKPPDADASTYAVWVLSQGEIKRHPITCGADGLMRVGGRPVGGGTLVHVVQYLSARQPGWATPLTTGVLGYQTQTFEDLEAKELAKVDAQHREEESKKWHELQERKKHHEHTRKRSIKLKEESLEAHERSLRVQEELNNPELEAIRAESRAQIEAQKQAAAVAAQKQEVVHVQVSKHNRLLEALEQVSPDIESVPLDSDDEDSALRDDVQQKWTPSKGKKSDGTPEYAFLHPPMSELEAHGWLNEYGGGQCGAYLVRLQSSKSTGSAYFIDVLHEDGGIHTHQVTRSKVKKGLFRELLVDGHSTAQPAIDLVLQYLGSIRADWWMVPLADYVRPLREKKAARQESKRIVAAERVRRKSK
eukprot:m.409109 g.409109  ORF g.409109 m.409109 type:complete len:597 (-) comp21242_c0_seq1:312-2102(-)